VKALGLALLLVACGRDTEAVLAAPPRGSNAAIAKAVAPNQQLAGLTTTLPTGWTASYDATGGRWSFTSAPVGERGPVVAHLAPMSAAVAPTPQDYLALLQSLDPHRSSKLLASQPLRDGFAITVEVSSPPGTAPVALAARPTRELHVVRHLRDVWLACECAEVPDDATRDQLIALCSSAAL
jgi:hypothetical protein